MDGIARFARWIDDERLATRHDIHEVYMALQDDLAGVVSAISNQITLEDAAVAQFVKDVSTLIQNQGNPALITGVQAAIAKLQTAAAVAATDTATLNTADAAAQAALPATAVQISPSPLNLAPGAQLTVTAVALNGTNVLPNQTFVWSTGSGTSIVTVTPNSPNNTALVVANAAGTDTITVIAGGQTATDAVTVAVPVVTPPPPPPGGATAAPAVAGSSNVGNATVGAVAPTASAVAETITVLFTDPADFTVAGSVSGSLGTGTVGAAFSSSVIGLTVTAGSVPSVAGDSYTIAVTLAAAIGTASASAKAAPSLFSPRKASTK